MKEFAYTATCAIGDLIQLGVPPAELEPFVREIAQHDCARNRDACSRFLHQYYDWLPPARDAQRT